MSSMRRPIALLAVFVVCLAIGLAVGLAYAWLVNPDTPLAAPDRLDAVDRDLYLRLVAAAYAADNDRARAEARVAAAGPEARARLGELVALDLAEGRSPRDVAALAAGLGVDGGAVALVNPPRPLPAATVPPVTAAPGPSPTPLPVRLLRQGALCDGTGSRLVVHLVDGQGRPMPGVALDLIWNGGQSSAYTGFSSAGDTGTVDFLLQPGIVYELELAGAVIATTLTAPTCPSEQPGGWTVELALID